MQSKIDLSLARISSALERSKNPCVLWSGGKDSTALLHLAREVRPNIECVFWTLPWMRGKLAFAQRLASDWNLTVHDAPPARSALCGGNGRIDVLESYSMLGQDQTMIVARGTEPREEGRPFVCGVDWLQRPKANAAFPFDLALHGHKSTDVDPCSGPVPLALDLYQMPLGGTDVLFPLREWTDPDVWTYHRANGIPWDRGRYSSSGEPLPDKTLNSDYFHACFDCCKQDSGNFVPCPKRGGQTVNNISALVPWEQPRMEYCNLRNKE